MKKVLVTGGSGFIAYHVIENLIKSNFNVTGVDLVDPKNRIEGCIYICLLYTSPSPRDNR